ncbi:MAG: endonuclease related protein [Chloroflexia bacterium]|jgi:endonuclease-3 related protein|nr:endonuclease related protein [Chloroflexia bacterium]
MAIYRTLLSHYGPQHWWPTLTGSRWEVMLGAVLVQRTTWRNADRALNNLLTALGPSGLSDPATLLSVPDETLVELLRPAGHFSRKPRTLKLLARLLQEFGGADALTSSALSTGELRILLLGIWGIGPETADAILLYTLGRPVFVADAYALRLGQRWGLLGPGASYDEAQRTFADNLPEDTTLFNEYHALIVEHGKQLCRPAPLCPMCPLNKPIKLAAHEGNGTWQCPHSLSATAGGTV